MMTMEQYAASLVTQKDLEIVELKRAVLAGLKNEVELNKLLSQQKEP